MAKHIQDQSGISGHHKKSGNSSNNGQSGISAKQNKIIKNKKYACGCGK